MTLHKMPHFDGEKAILERGSFKYGWHWLRDDLGDWWAAKKGASEILQVKGRGVDSMARWWVRHDSGFMPRPQFVALRSLLVIRD